MENPSIVQDVFIQFRSLDNNNEFRSSILSISASSNKKDLEILLNELLKNEEFTQYTFSLDGIHLSTSLQDTLGILSKTSKFEETLILDYFTEAIFRVKPITRCSSTLSGHTDAILCCAFSPDGKILVTGSGDRMVRFWDLQTETPFTLVSSHQDWVLCVSWSPDGHFLASGCKDGTIQIWEASTQKPFGAPIKAHSKWITGLSWEPAHLRYPCERLCSSSRDGSVKIWNVMRKSCEAILSQHTDSVTAVRWSGRGKIYSTSRDKTVRIWSSNDGRQLAVLEGHAHWVNTLALNTDYILRTGPFDHRGKFVIEGDPKKSSISKFESFKQEEILVTGSDDFTMFLWSPNQSNKPIARLTGHQALVNHVAFSPDGHYISSASFDKSIKVWNATTGKLIHSLRGHVNSVYQIAWSADSRLLASCSKDSTVKVWHVLSGKLKQDLPGHLDEVFTVDWSPTGEKAASGGRDKLIKIWRQ